MSDDLFITYIDGKYRIYKPTRGGIGPIELVGPKAGFLTPKQAGEYIDRLNSLPRVSPLRAPEERSSPGVPTGSVEASPSSPDDPSSDALTGVDASGSGPIRT